jgi:CheY-like chemotaxis protein
MAQTKVLVVDDDASLRVTLAANLELEGFKVLEADSGEAALAAVQAEGVDLVLTDIRMPGIDGVQLFRRLKRLLPGVPVVLMTAFALEQLVQEALGEGVFALLFKPFDVGLAARMIDRAAHAATVLVVDDAQENASYIAEVLREAGLRAVAVFDGESALETVKQGNIDVCVVDMVMPGVDGPQFARRLRELNASVALIAMSGLSIPEMIQQMAAAGAFSVMRKPFMPRELMRVIAGARSKV